ncbi:MAG: 3-oxoacid CoA-transferase subunit B [Bdellovibrionales bacterium]|nr:3-oxoacid CoA-transferase subunit B [Bdellovibrionales bacterium]
MTHAAPSKSKVYPNAAAALADLKDGASVMSGGFGLCGIAENCIDELERRELKQLTVISNNVGNSGRGLAKLLKKKQIRKAVCSYVGGNPDLEKAILAKEVEVDLVPQGTFAERMRAAGMGVRAFYTPTGYATLVAEGKETKTFDRPCILETALHADFAIIKAQKGDRYGNLWFKETARNFSPLMAMAAKVTIAEVEELVELGDIPPENVHVPGLFVHRIFQGKDYKNDIEFLKLADDTGATPGAPAGAKGWSEAQMADEVVALFSQGCSVNLGIGMPTLVAERTPKHLNVMMHSENGVLGVSGRPTRGSVSPTLINAGKETIAVAKGASFFDSSMSFGMIRGGHIDFCVLGGMEVDSERGLANWMIPGKKVTGMGGAMDLVNGARQVIIMLRHKNKEGETKLVKRCSLPLTGKEVVNTVVTDLGVFAPTGKKFRVLKLAPGVKREDLGIPEELLEG